MQGGDYRRFANVKYIYRIADPRTWQGSQEIDHRPAEGASSEGVFRTWARKAGIGPHEEPSNVEAKRMDEVIWHDHCSPGKQ